MRYGTPTAFRMALTRRLQDRAAASGRSAQRLLQMVTFERFLARVFRALGERATLKGGVAMELRVERARTTRDIDLRLAGEHPERLLETLREVGALDLGDFFSFQVDSDRTLTVRGLPYEGRRYRVQAFLGGTRIAGRFQIDVVLAEPMAAGPELLIAPSLLAFAELPSTEMWLYPVELHLAEKLHAYTLERERANTRLKDLPDLALLGGVGPLESGRFRRILDETFLRRATHPLPDHTPEPPGFWSEAYRVMAREDDLPWPELAGLMAVVRAFLDPVLADAAAGSWDPAAWAWSPPA